METSGASGSHVLESVLLFLFSPCDLFVRKEVILVLAVTVQQSDCCVIIDAVTFRTVFPEPCVSLLWAGLKSVYVIVVKKLPGL